MLKITNITKTFNKNNGGKVLAISNLNLNVDEHEFVCIVGASGCGKTTTLRLISGLDVPTEGKIFLDGNKINGPGPERGVVFQEYTLFPWRSVLENVTFGLEVKNIDKRKRRQTAKKYLEMVGLADYADAYPYELSGGMQQRVAIIRALTLNPKVLLMDEPFGALDARTRDFLQNQLLRIWVTERKTILFVTHSINEAVFLADRVVVMKNKPGRIHDVIEIDAPRPRNKMSKKFKDYYTIIHGMLENGLDRDHF
ncbi:MAG: ABC transporter ATP-binding protein [Deltaproteobacteria bacterium]|nr:ABC transporter ATP-binding protein [Deltaproteobacteria bacterium]